MIRPIDSLLIAPIVTGFVTGNLCRMPETDLINIRPPTWVFPLAWSFNYLLLGMILHSSVAHANYRDPVLATLVISHLCLVMSWPFFFSCKRDPKRALYLLTGALTTMLLVWTRLLLNPNPRRTAGPLVRLLPYAVVPYLSWLGYAAGMNAIYVEQTAHKAT